MNEQALEKANWLSLLSLFEIIALVTLVVFFCGFSIFLIQFFRKWRKAQLASAEKDGKETRNKKQAVHEMLEPVPEKKVVSRSLGAALKPTRDGFIAKISSLLLKISNHEELFEELESILFTADIGVTTAEKLLQAVKVKLLDKNQVGKTIYDLMKEEIRNIFSTMSVAAELPEMASSKVILFVGVNGVGKTTTIGKLCYQLKLQGKSVLLGAGDTFRAAAKEQLSIWADRAAVPIVAGKDQADPASVLFDAAKKAKQENIEFVLCDTAGRLHTKTNLMDQLGKVHRVLGKAIHGAPHEVFLVVDATMGQNAIAQAKEFAKTTPLTGIILTKLDGTAKGGVAIGIVDELGVPIRYIGVGEGIEDLRPFDSNAFVDALFDSKKAQVGAIAA